MTTDYEIVIGLEVHVQLATESKIFCSASAAFGSDPNDNIDPLTFGLPGSLPVLNKEVAESAITLGLALNCQIRNFNRFARKHYFYPDLPKGYQISQFDEPICEHGRININVNDSTRTIGITRIHMEEDAGKNIHDARTSASLVDLNRAGVPLLEVVSEPDLRSPGEASAYLKKIRQLVRYLGVSDGNMEEGSLRCDANISLRPKGQLKFGTRTEIKNINSFKFVERALEYEIARQHSILKKGELVIQQTRLFDNINGTTHAMRSKEESADYRYFPDPDLPPLVVEESWIQEVRAHMPKLPDEYKEELVDKHGLSTYDAEVLTSERSWVTYFDEVLSVSKDAKLSCNWVTSELFGALKKEGLEVEESPVSAKNLGELVALITKKTVSGKIAKDVFEEMFKTGKKPQEIIKEKGIEQITDEGKIAEMVTQVFNQNEAQSTDYVGGKDKLHGFFVGQVMKISKGAANPEIVNKLILEERKKRQ